MEQLLRRFLLFLSVSPAARYMAVRFPLTRRVARRFVAGESLEEAIQAVVALTEQGFLTSLDLLGENVDGLGEADLAKAEVLQAITALKALRVDCNLSIKLTQLGLDTDPEVARKNVDEILQATQGLKTTVRVDMESSEYTQSTINLVTNLRAKFPNVGTVLQSYLRRCGDDVQHVNEHKIPVRLCKGAYMEGGEVAYQTKSEVDANYLHCAEELLTKGCYPAFATHDEAMIQGVLSLVQRLELSADDFEFQMLYGIRQDRQRELLKEGWNVRLYVPYGQSWYPYFMRRLAERPQNLLFMITALVRG